MATSEVITQELVARDPDVTLMLQVRDDVAGAFGVLVDRYQNRLLGFLAHVVGDTAEAEELTVQVFRNIHRVRKGYQPKTRFSTWFFNIAYGVVKNQLPGKGRPGGDPRDVSAGDSRPIRSTGHLVPVKGALPAGPPTSEELAEAVRAAVATLDQDQRIAVLLSKFEGMSYAEIAQVMNRSEASIRSLLARTRMELREQLDPYLKMSEKIV